MAITLANEQRCEEFKGNYQKYDYLWKLDLQTSLKEFIEAEGSTLPDGTKDDPALARFESQITKYKNIQTEIGGLKDTMTIGYVKVNAKPLRQALGTWASKWTYLYTHYLQEKVINSITELYAFMDVSNTTLDLKVRAGRGRGKGRGGAGQWVEMGRADAAVHKHAHTCRAGRHAKAADWPCMLAPLHLRWQRCEGSVNAAHGCFRYADYCQYYWHKLHALLWAVQLSAARLPVWLART